MKRPLKSVPLVFVLAFLASITACAQETEELSANSSNDLSAFPTSGWPTNGGDLYNRRHSPLDQINRENVGNLKGVWRTHLGGSGAGQKNSGEAQPIVVDGVAYISTGDDDVFALSIDTGEILWQYRAELPDTLSTVCCGWISRGVGVGGGLIYIGQLDAKLVALDQNTGEVVWETQAERWQESYTITAAPLYYDGLVITGFAGGEYGVRGRVKAYDATDGSLVWTFNTTPGPGEFGHDTWPADNNAWETGGASVWHTPAVDPALGMIYFSTGNAGPSYNGSQRAGDNLFTASILALDVKTGEYRWHFQEVHHDIWDYDAPNPVILFDLEVEGIERKGLAQAGKTGWVYILDRITGEPIIGIEEKEVLQEPRMATAATQPYPIGDSFVPQSLDMAPEGLRLINKARIFTPFYLDELVLIAPGMPGGANWPPSAIDPESGHMFICAAHRPYAFGAQELDPERGPGTLFTAGTGVFPMHNVGILAAMDLHTNTLVWQQYWKEPCFSGNTTTAGGLLFIGRNDGRLTALDTKDGSLLWEFQTGAGMNAPVSIFEYNGTQYVIAYSAGNLLAPSVRGDSVWLFALDGSMDESAPGVASFGPGAQVPVDIAMADGEADLAAGKIVFQSICSACHGPDGKGGHGGGSSLVDSHDAKVVVDTIIKGGEQMPPLAAAFTPEQLRDVAAYVTSTLAE